jgi:hypothetical protein
LELRLTRLPSASEDDTEVAAGREGDVGGRAHGAVVQAAVGPGAPRYDGANDGVAFAAQRKAMAIGMAASMRR